MSASQHRSRGFNAAFASKSESTRRGSCFGSATGCVPALRDCGSARPLRSAADFRAAFTSAEGAGAAHAGRRRKARRLSAQSCHPDGAKPSSCEHWPWRLEPLKVKGASCAACPTPCEGRADRRATPPHAGREAAGKPLLQSAGTVRPAAQARSAAIFSAISTDSGLVPVSSARSSAWSGRRRSACAA